MLAVRRTVMLIAAATAVATGPVATAAAETYYVGGTGASDANACTDPAAPCQTIQGALDKPGFGDTVRVAPGTYDDPVSVDDASMTIEGTGTGTPPVIAPPGGITVNGAGTTLRDIDATNPSATTAISVNAADFTLDGGVVSAATTGVLFSAVQTLTVRDSVIGNAATGSTATGIRVDRNGANPSDGVTIQGNVFTGNTNGAVVFAPNSLPANPTTNVSYNRFAANTAQGDAGTAIQNTVGDPDVAISAPDNFFGCNAGSSSGTPGCGTVSGPVTATPYLKLALSPAAAQATVGDVVGLTASLVEDSGATPPLAPDPFPSSAVAFGADPSTASVAPATATTDSSSASATSALGSTAPGTVTATATLDNAVASASVTFAAAASTSGNGGGQQPPTASPPARAPSPPVRNPLRGTDGNDRIVGTPGDDVIDAGDGNDVIDGLGGNDVIVGGRGNDRIVGGSGRDRMAGGPGDDRLIGGAGEDRLSGGSGRDTLLGGADDDVVAGESGGDHVYGNDGNDRADGGTGEDRVQGDSGDDVVTGADGDDHGDGGSGRDRVVGGAGDDVLTGGSGRDRLLGGAGDDLLIGGSDRDVLSGGPGADRARQ